MTAVHLAATVAVAGVLNTTPRYTLHYARSIPHPWTHKFGPLYEYIYINGRHNPWPRCLCSAKGHSHH